MNALAGTLAYGAKQSCGVGVGLHAGPYRAPWPGLRPKQGLRNRQGPDRAGVPYKNAISERGEGRAGRFASGALISLLQATRPACLPVTRASLSGIAVDNLMLSPNPRALCTEGITTSNPSWVY